MSEGDSWVSFKTVYQFVCPLSVSSCIYNDGDDGTTFPASLCTIRTMASSLLGLLQDGAHRRDDRCLGAGGSGCHRDNSGQRCSSGDDCGLGQGHWDCRVPFAFPLLSI